MPAIFFVTPELDSKAVRVVAVLVIIRHTDVVELRNVTPVDTIRSLDTFDSAARHILKIFDNTHTSLVFEIWFLTDTVFLDRVARRTATIANQFGSFANGYGVFSNAYLMVGIVRNDGRASAKQFHFSLKMVQITRSVQIVIVNVVGLAALAEVDVVLHYDGARHVDCGAVIRVRRTHKYPVAASHVPQAVLSVLLVRKKDNVTRFQAIRARRTATTLVRNVVGANIIYLIRNTRTEIDYIGIVNSGRLRFLITILLTSIQSRFFVGRVVIPLPFTLGHNPQTVFVRVNLVCKPHHVAFKELHSVDIAFAILVRKAVVKLQANLYILILGAIAFDTYIHRLA